jgi:hypothetical protein
MQCAKLFSTLFYQSRGIYLATLFYTKDDKILVTLDENLPIVEVDDASTCSFTQEFQWLLKVGYI